MWKCKENIFTNRKCSKIRKTRYERIIKGKILNNSNDGEFWNEYLPIEIVETVVLVITADATNKEFSPISNDWRDGKSK